MSKKKLTILVAMVLALITINSVSHAEVYFNFTNVGPGNNDWQYTSQVSASTPDWQIHISSSDRPSVGRVWYPNGTWASALYTYPANLTNSWRPSQDYRTVVADGDQVKWGMRLNNDYTGVLNVSGWFYP